MSALLQHVASVNGVPLHAPDEALDDEALRQRACTELLRQAAIDAGLLAASLITPASGARSSAGSRPACMAAWRSSSEQARWRSSSTGSVWPSSHRATPLTCGLVVVGWFMAVTSSCSAGAAGLAVPKSTVGAVVMASSFCTVKLGLAL